MSEIEREIVDKFHQLDQDAQKRVREMIEYETGANGQSVASAFDFDQWFRDVEALRREFQRQHGSVLPPLDVVGLLRDIRNGDDE